MTPGDSPPGGVQSARRVLQQDLGSVDPGSFLPGQFQQPGNRPRLHQDVVVQQQEVVGRRLASAFFPFQSRLQNRVEGARVSPVLVQRHQTLRVLYRRGGTVGGSIVHDDGLEWWEERGA